MARVTVSDCLEHVDNRFQLVLIATKRARQLILGAEPLVERGADKPTVLALREIAEGHIGPSILEEADPVALAELNFSDDDGEGEWTTEDDGRDDGEWIEADTVGGVDEAKSGEPVTAAPVETERD